MAVQKYKYKYICLLWFFLCVAFLPCGLFLMWSFSWWIILIGRLGRQFWLIFLQTSLLIVSIDKESLRTNLSKTICKVLFFYSLPVFTFIKALIVWIDCAIIRWKDLVKILLVCFFQQKGFKIVKWFKMRKEGLKYFLLRPSVLIIERDLPHQYIVTIIIFSAIIAFSGVKKGSKMICRIWSYQILGNYLR